MTASFTLPDLYRRGEALIARLPAALPLLGLRIALAIPFWRSGLTKWDGFGNLSLGARYLFEQEFRLHILGAAIPYPMPLVMAWLAGVGEIVLPILLILGLATRYAALGILLMTAIIQLTVPDGWLAYHLPWAVMALVLMRYGAGWASLDQAILARRRQPMPAMG
ncbi:putative oxidoreductase [Devosia enhydra]|uniref:Putative oxidoreductase n=1 Tax=Devosia enhydra TaxID=665118 RepID=A0A1K2HWS0_9HYPH|nr:DoxX family protein [Devosia enhydra]SFZ83525.1 putative oxidoreductase [Devosia enhydra]